MSCGWIDKVFALTNAGFESLALDVFRFQYQDNLLYKKYAEALDVALLQITRFNEIPFLPINFFKTHTVQTTPFIAEIVFESSGTTKTFNSRHFIKDVLLYEKSIIRSFELYYGSIKEWCVIGLLPSYLERNNSSLVYMVDKLIQLSDHRQSGFYLYEYEKLFAVLKELEKKKERTLLLGVTFALLDFAGQYSLKLDNTVIMETGGMKGRQKEMIRSEVHHILCNALGVSSIHSEYGMTEILSQAYSPGKGIFHCPPWMKVLVRDEDDPLLIKTSGIGALNIVDLANIYSCSFIATDDVGKVYDDGSFEVTGRMDRSDLRGCSLLVV